MMVERFFTPGLAQVAYLVADEATGDAALIDPRRDVDEYMAWTRERGLTITAILETHIHADFVSGARELAAATKAPIFVSAYGGPAWADHMLQDGEKLPVGRLLLRALGTPGHTPEHLSYLLIDPDQGAGPVALFSGDALFAGEVGRPDLLGAEATERLAGQLYHTVVDRLSRLDDAVVVYPGHTAGSACGKKIGDAPRTSIGHEKRFNYAFQARSKESFVLMVLAGMPAPPTYYPVLKGINAAGPPLLATLPPGEGLEPGEVLARQAAGALVIDSRTPADFGTAHLPGALFAGLGASFTTWMGWIAPFERDVILVLCDDTQYPAARTELRRIGLDRVGGYLQGGMERWRGAGLPLEALPGMTVAALAKESLGTGGALTVLDVRSPDEWREAHIPGSINLFAGDIAQGAEPAFPREAWSAVMCGSGYRSSVAASLLRQHGWSNLINVQGGMAAWSEADYPVAH